MLMRNRGGMKRITYADESLITTNEIADRLVDYAVRVSQLGTSSAVSIPVLESNGLIVEHTLVINSASQIDVVDVDGHIDGHETDRFGEPTFPPVGVRATVQPVDVDQLSEFDGLGDLS
jgi:hypothetical protein